MKLAILILAAGQASRFGDCKQLALYSGKPLLQTVLENAEQVAPGQVYIVTGAWHENISVANLLPKSRLIFNPYWAQGMGGSIVRGVAQLADNYDAIFILLADQIAISVPNLRQLLVQFDGKNIVCSFYAGKRGVPALFGKNSFFKLRQLNGDKGAKDLLYDEAFQVFECPLENAIFDIDTPEDLKNYPMP